jgi:hypothetical protein
MSAEFPQHLLDGLERSHFDALCRSAEEQDDPQLKRGHKLRHNELEPWVARAWKEASYLKLGCGPGYFQFVCRKLGHRCVGLDEPGFFPFWKGLH